MQRTSSEIRSELRSILAQEGIRAALIYLNALTGHRFTALYRFDDETLANIYFYDRQNPEEHSSEDIPVTASYCVFVRNFRTKFSVTDSSRDARVDGHPKQQQVKAYCGVPLLDRSGAMFGTICHFDFDPMGITDANIHLMETMADLIKEGEHPTGDRAPAAGREEPPE